jgi:GMP synthase (glutamine-hydrolysing)
MKKILILKTGTSASVPEIARLGDFDDWIISGTQADKNNFIISSPFKGEKLPAVKNLSGIIITGSPTMITENPEWLQPVSEWLLECFTKKIPTLGICFGHQLIALTLGGKIKFHSRGTEIGTVKINLTTGALKDPLFYNIPDQIKAHVVHSQSIATLPAEAEILAYNDFEPHHSFVINNHIWGLQFHPEFDEEITKTIINVLRDDLATEGLNIKEILDSVSSASCGPVILKNFFNIAEKFRQKQIEV